MALREDTQILGNPRVHGSSNLLCESVKNADTGSAGGQERAQHTPHTPRQYQTAQRNLQRSLYRTS